MSTLELCEKYFGTRDIYKLLEITKDSLLKDVKKAYYKLSLQVHPDRVEESEKETATEKFKVLSKLYQVLTDKEKRALYDEQGLIDDEDDMIESKLTSWLELWKKIFKPLTLDDITNYQNSYVNSELERTDMKKAYLSCKGNIDKMMNEIPFLKVEDEPRLQKIIGEMIAAEEVPEYKDFTHEPAQRRTRRHKKYARESKEADEIKKKLQEKEKKQNTEEEGGDLQQMIMKRAKAREANFDSLLDKLAEKYGKEDDSAIIDLGSKVKKPKRKSLVKNDAAASTPKNAVKNGRVEKKRKN